jgi:hypothetical protein
MEPDAPPAAAPATVAIGAAQRLVESATIAVVTSTGLYLVGSVYTDAYYGRMSIEVTTLDLAPHFIALQSSHALPGLLQYPTILLAIYAVGRLFAGPALWLRYRFDGLHRRLGRTVLIVANVAVVAPLVFVALYAGNAPQTYLTTSVLTEVANLMEVLGLILLVYVVWLGSGPRVTLLSQLRQRRPIPIVLLFAVYLLNALVATADGAARAAELVLTGQSESSVGVAFTMRDGSPAAPPASGLILVTARNGNYFAVERQPFPPTGRPTAYAVPFASVDAVQMQRLNAADVMLDEPPFDWDAPVPGR